MKCPACGKITKSKDVSGLTLEICEEGCAGVWFDQFELKKLDEKHEVPKDFLQQLDARKKTVAPKKTARNCPKCESIVMMSHFFGVGSKVEVDHCPSCAGYWLDCGELSQIHKEYDKDADRQAANLRLIEQEFGTELSKMATESRAKLAEAQKIAKIFRFVLPSNYIPGKQSGGAF